jgi:predicted NBD/HSP70 family sugar kinase
MPTLLNPVLATSRAAEVMRAVHLRPGITRAELAATVGLSTGMASDIVAALVKSEQLSEGEAPPGGGRGRPTRSLWPHPAGPLVAVASIAHETWQVEAIGVGGQPVISLAGRHDREAAEVLTEVAGAFARLWERHGHRVQSFAVSVPGTVSGTRLVQAANLGWQGLELAELRPAGAAGIPLSASNDATCSAIAELTRGAAVGTATSLHLFMDSGVGGALIEGGQVVTGAHGMAGEFGHMPFGARRARCRCGARGCWNTELEGAALALGLGLPVPADEVSFSRAILTAARDGRRDELRVVGRAARALGRGLAGLVNATDPELVVLGGLASEMLAAAPQRIERTYRDGLMSTIAARPPALVGGTLGDRAPLLGAMEAAFEPVLARPPV